MTDPATSMGLVLRTPRLELIPISTDHAAGLFPLMSDPRISTYLTWAPHEDVAETARVLESLQGAQAAGKAFHWTILHRNTASGIISLIDVARTHRLWRLDRAEVAYWVGAPYQGAGFATEASRVVVNCAFTDLGLHRLRISHTSMNPASGRIPQRLGFRFVGTERDFFQKDGVWHDMNHYEMLAADWHATGENA